MLRVMHASLASDIRSALERGFDTGQILGAYLFCGPPGTGKRATSLWWSARLLDAPEPTEDSERLWHPDFHLVEPEGSRLKIDQLRQLQRDLSLVANEGGRRVGLVLGAERMGIQGANALLKILEEPPAGTTLILVTTAAEALPATVRSRTSEYRFAAPSSEQLREQLIRDGIDPEDAWLVGALAGGSLEGARAWSESHLDDARELLTQLADLNGASASATLDFAETFRGGGEKLRERTELFLDVFYADARHRVEAAVEAGRSDEIARWLDRAEGSLRARAEYNRRNLNAQMLVEGLLT